MFVNISKLKVFEFNGEECVIAKSYKEAYDYYIGLIGEDYIKKYVGELEIEELNNWYEIELVCEGDEISEEIKTMGEIAKELYSNGYTGAEMISSVYL